MAGDIRRPEADVLPDGALVPDRNLIAPAPNQFTHELVRPQSFRFDGVSDGAPPSGQLAAGTPVVLLVHDGGPRCRVADGRGVYVEIEYDSLRRL